MFLGLLFAAVACQASPDPAGEDERPNFVIVYVDDVGWGDLALRQELRHVRVRLGPAIAVKLPGATYLFDQL